MILLTISLIVGCGKDENASKTTCDLTNPIEELQWLKEIKNSLTNCSCEMSILQGTYDDQTVFYVAMTDPLCNGIQTIVLNDCNGKIVKTINSGEYQEFLAKIKNVKALYRCKTAG
jgi:sulfur transfer protein SufE